MDKSNKNNRGVNTAAIKLHLALRKCHRTGNRARLKFILNLLALYQSRQYQALGSPGIAPYTEKHFQMTRTKTFDFIKVGEKADALPRAIDAFRAGDLCWSVLKEISRVAVKETEEKWLAWAKGKSVRMLKAEVKDAMAKERSLPREDRYGLPNCTVDQVFKLTLEEDELVTKAFEKVASELQQSLGGEGVIDRKTAFLYMSQRFLETDPEGTPKDRVEKEESVFTLLYHTCPKCHASHIQTQDGPVEVPKEHVERIEGEATTEEIRIEEEIPGASEEASLPIDRPNPPSLVRKVYLRDGARCANPHCRRRGCVFHAHHLVHREDGGRTTVWNVVNLCLRCHSLHHRGFLEIKGNPVLGLVWKTKADGIELEPDDEAEEIREMPVYKAPQESTRVNGSSVNESHVQIILRNQGYTLSEIPERIREALGRLRDRLGCTFTTEDLIKEALRGR